MTINNVKILCINGEDRVLFDSYTENDDINPSNGKIGIRCHHWFAAFFIWLFWNGIVNIEDINGKVYPLNRYSYDQWRARQAEALKIQKANPTELPSVEEIIAAHKFVMEEAEKAAAANQNMQALIEECQALAPAFYASLAWY